MPETARTQKPRQERAPFGVVCEARQGARPWQRVVLNNLSAEGFRLSGLEHTCHSMPVKVRIPGLQVLSATIRWHRGPEMGCKFSAPLHVAVFEHLVNHARMKPHAYM